MGGCQGCPEPPPVLAALALGFEPKSVWTQPPWTSTPNKMPKRPGQAAPRALAVSAFYVSAAALLILPGEESWKVRFSES